MRNKTKTKQLRFVLFELPNGKRSSLLSLLGIKRVILSKALLFMENEVYVEISGRVQA